MKDYNEMAKAVLKRRDEYIASRKKQRAMLLKAGVPLCSLVLVCLVGLTFWINKLPDLPIAPTKPTVSTTDNTNTEINTLENTESTQNIPQTNTKPVENTPNVDPTEPKTSKPSGNTGDVPATDSDGKPGVIPPGIIQGGTAATNPAVPPNVDATSAVDPTEPQSPIIPDEPVVTAPAVDPTVPVVTDYPLPTDSWCPPAPTVPWYPKPTDSVVMPTEPCEPSETDPTEPTEAPTGPLTINVGGKQYTAQVGDMVTYTAELYVKDYFESFMAGVLYDSKLEIVEVVNPMEEDPAPVHYPNLTGGSELLNYHRDRYAEKEICVVASKISGYKFKEPKVLFTFDFIVKRAGETNIALKIEDLTAKGGEPYYFSGGRQLIFEGINTEEYLTVTPSSEVVIPTSPKEEEEEETVPPFTYPEESFDSEAQIICDDRTYSADVGQRVTYVVELEAQEKFEYIQAMVKFGDGLEAYEPIETEDLYKENIAMPNLKGVASIDFRANHIENNQSVPVVKMNASTHIKFDFRRRKVLMQIDFIVTEPGEYNIDLIIEEMYIRGAKYYFNSGEQVIFDGIEIYEYIIVN